MEYDIMCKNNGITLTKKKVCFFSPLEGYFLVFSLACVCNVYACPFAFIL